ncbi:MAG: YhdP family protein, partial [Gammaproteobacteria bacterium]
MHPTGVGRVAPLGNTLPAELAEALVGLQPEGWLNRVHLDWTDSVAATANADGTPSIDQPAMDQAEEYAFDAQLRSANIRPWQDIPGIKGMSADLSARPGVLSAVLLSRDISLDFPGLFRDPLNLSKLDGLLAVVHGEQGIRISGAELKLSNPDIALGGDFRLVLPEQGSPELKIDANFVGEPEDQVPHYLPAGVIPDEAMAFLDRAFLAGKARNGVLRFRGPINDFPFDAPEGEEPTGEFLTAFDVIDGALDFSPDYPNIEQATAHVRFHNKSLTVEGQSARIMGAEVSDVIVTIPDLNDTTVRVQGKARAELSQFEDFVRATPLQERIGPSLKDLALRGEAGLELEVYMPFDGKDMEVSGVLDFPGNDLFVKPMNVRFSDFKGGLSFDGEGVKAKGLSAGFRGEKLNIDVATSANGDTDIELRANLPLQAALGPDGEGMLPFVSGKADWLVRIQAPSWRRSSAATRVSVESDLQGIELSLPKPLEKPGHEKQSFVLETEQGPDGLGPIHVQLGEALDGLFVVTDDRPFSGELRYGLGKAPMPEQPGLAIEARTEETALGGWVELANQGGDDGAAQGGSDWLRLVDARVDRLHAYGRLVRDAHVRLEPSDPSESGPGWKLDVDSKRVAGTILVPNQPGENQPVFAAFTHLHLAKREQEASGESPTDPRELPPIRLIVDDFRYGDFNLGRLELEALPTARGLSVQQMDLNSDALTLHSWGTWGFDGQDHQSQFTI